MSNMISVASGFQYSVNIGYDLNNDDKLKNFIPTQSALTLLEDILLSTRITSTERARVLIGAYGKGKSHIILMILSMLMKKDISLFEKLLPKLESNKRLHQCVLSYYESDQKLLPVIINGSNTSLPQAFLLALQRTLAENELLDIMPETNYKAAVAVIQRWKTDFPDTYVQLQKAIDEPIGKFIEDLEDYSIKQGAFEEEKKQKENSRSELSLLDKNNQMIELYKAYTQRIYDELNAEYKQKEAQIRTKLQMYINEIFKSIYDGGLSLTIDEHYNISVYVTDFDGGVETSTAQSISVIFAFISAIIKMARENQLENGDEAYSEPYPLVMDAPLSAFDKRRIKAICSAIPETAEQVIIFIKDTDGELAEEHLGTKVISSPTFSKKPKAI